MEDAMEEWEMLEQHEQPKPANGAAVEAPKAAEAKEGRKRSRSRERKHRSGSKDRKDRDKDKERRRWGACVVTAACASICPRVDLHAC